MNGALNKDIRQGKYLLFSFVWKQEFSEDWAVKFFHKTAFGPDFQYWHKLEFKIQNIAERFVFSPLSQWKVNIAQMIFLV